MALPRISAKSYNYGQYANPTPIKYKGGLGEGLAQAGTAYFMAKKAAADKKAELDAKNLIENKKKTATKNKELLSNWDAFMKGTEDIIDLLDPHNTLFLHEMGENYAKNRQEFKETNDFEKFTKIESKYKKQKQQIINLFEIAKLKAEKENKQPYTFYKQTEGNLDSYALDNALSTFKIKLDYDEDDNLVVGYGMVGADQKPKLEYEKIQEIFANPSSHNPTPKFIFDAEKYKNYGKLFEDKIKENPELKTRIISRKSGGIEFADLNSAIEVVKESKAVKDEALRAGKSIWEDILDYGRNIGQEGDYDVQKHLGEIETLIASKIIDNTNLKIGKVSEKSNEGKELRSKNINALGKKLQNKVLPLFSNFDDPNIANLVTYIEGLTGIESVDISKIIKKGDKEAFKVKGSAKDVTIDTGMSQAQIKVALLKAAGATDEEIENFNLTKTESEFSVGGSEFPKPNKNPLLND